MRGSVIGLLLAVLVTGAIFGGAYLIVTVIVPAMIRGESIELLRWGVIALITGFLVYRLFGRFRRRRRARREKEFS